QTSVSRWPFRDRFASGIAAASAANFPFDLPIGHAGTDVATLLLFFATWGSKWLGPGRDFARARIAAIKPFCGRRGDSHCARWPARRDISRQAFGSPRPWVKH